MRLIDADGAYKMAKDDKRYSAFHYRKADLGDLYYLVLVDSPTIEAEPVRHGKWDDSGRYTFADGSLAIRCSECGCSLHQDEYQKYNWNYCPVCGAKMDGGCEK